MSSIANNPKISLTYYDSINDDYLQFYDNDSSILLSDVIKALQDILSDNGDMKVYQLSEGRDIDSGMSVILSTDKTNSACIIF